jgi:hypothetical protein
MARSAGLSAAQRRTLDRLARVRAIHRFYLAGGTAIAFHLGHRRSLDLDLFSFDQGADLEEVRREVVERVMDVEILSVTSATLRIRVAETPVDIVSYPYGLLEAATDGPAGLPVAGLIDLATMKLSAVARRGLRRDFWDLETLITRGGVTLQTAADAYLRRFGVKEADLYAVLRSLTYFADAESDPIWPAGLDDAKWRTLRAFFEREAPRLLLG